MRRLVVLAALLGLLAASCAEAGEPEAFSPGSPSPAASPTTDDLEGASCEPREGGDPGNFPDFVEVSIEPEGETEKVEFRFEPEDDPDAAPQWFTSFADELVTEGEGAPVEVAGEAFVSFSFMARGVDLEGEEFRDIYTGPVEFAPGLSTVLEVEHLGDFEGLVTWGIGLSHEACFVVEERPDRLILEFPAAA